MTEPARAQRAPRRPIGVAARALLALCAVSCARDEAAPAAERGGATARAVQLVELLEEIGPKELSDGELEPLLVNFWATWCPPCVAELPDLDRAARENADGLRVVAVSLDLAQPYAEDVDGPDDVAAFAAERGLDLEILVLDGAVEPLNASLDLPGPIPFTYARDRHGRIVARHAGQASLDDFRELAAAAQR